MRLIIAGSRTVRPSIVDIDAACEGALFVIEDVIEVISGCAPGADEAGEVWALHHGKPVHHEPITADDVKRWGKYLAPKMRNVRMGDRGDAALIFWDGTSNGSTDMAARMLVRSKPVRVIPTKRFRRHP